MNTTMPKTGMRVAFALKPSQASGVAPALSGLPRDV